MKQIKTALREELESLRPFATARQLQFIDAILTHGSSRAASRSLGVGTGQANKSIQALRRHAAMRGWSPKHGMVHTVPEPFVVKGISTLYDAAGEKKAEWVKSRLDEEQVAQQMREFVAALSENVVPKTTVVRAPQHVESDIMVGYPIGDHHFGMLAWGRESGTDYDLKIAQDCLAGAIDHLVASAPPAETALLCNLGDFLHVDNRTNRTPQNSNPLDTDSRFARIARTAAFALAHATERLLEKHKSVKVVNVAGNHDPDSTSWVSLVLEAYFRNEPRVLVDRSPAKLICHQFGKNMIGMTHGDTIKLPLLAGVMASYYPVVWGETTHRYGWTGHVHHSQTIVAKENHGLKAESFGVLPPLDAYGASMGFLAQREMSAIVFKASGGEWGRIVHNIDMPRTYT